MTSSRNTALFAVISIAVMAGGSVRAEEANARLIREAKDLFRVIEAGELAPEKERCSVDKSWSSQTIPEEIVRAQFRLRLHADLAAPYQSSTPAEVLDLGEGSAEIFCDRKELESYREERLAALNSGKEESIIVGMSDYTFPVFNDSFTKAIVIHSSFGQSWYRNESGFHNGSLGFGSTALVYTKIKGRWHEAASISLGRT